MRWRSPCPTPAAPFRTRWRRVSSSSSSPRSRRAPASASRSRARSWRSTAARSSGRTARARARSSRYDCRSRGPSMSDPATLLIADDDPGLRESLERTLTREGFRVILASDGRGALERLQGGGIDLVVTDLKMPGLTGIEVLRAAKAIAPDVDVILLTAFGTVEEAVKAMKDGAYDFLTKPFRREQLLKLISKALERRDLIEQNRALKKQLEDLRAKGQVIGSSPAFRRMMTLVEQVADSSATVLIQGESGASARTSTTGSTSSRSVCHRSASVTRTSASSPSTSCASTLPRTAGSSRASRARRSSGSRPTRGRGT